MADKEPRRRKKRKDLPRKVHFTDDNRADELSFFTPKVESRESDQETEEDIIVLTHEPSRFAKLVFILLFSALVMSMGFVFISLHGTERGPVDIFDTDHADDHLSDSLKEEILESDVISKTEEQSEPTSILEEILPTFDDDNKDASQDFSFSDDSPLSHSEISEQDFDLKDHPDEKDDDDANMEDIEPPFEKITLEYTPEFPTTEDTNSDFQDIDTEPLIPDIEKEELLDIEKEQLFTSEKKLPDIEKEELADVKEELEPISDLSSTDDVTYENGDEFEITEGFVPEENQDDGEDDLQENEAYESYENYEITNSEDYEIKEKLDEIDDTLKKDLYDDDDDDDDDEDDYDDEEGEDEFDFWQF